MDCPPAVMPPTFRYIKNNLIFKIKHNGVYQVQLVACGYIQVLGIDFSKNYSLVVDDITFCILLPMVIYFGYLAKIVDTEMAFLFRELGRKL